MSALTARYFPGDDQIVSAKPQPRLSCALRLPSADIVAHRSAAETYGVVLARTPFV